MADRHDRTALGAAEGKAINEDPFSALVALARRSDKPVYLVPELFVWERWTRRMKPALMDRVFGSPDTPGFAHSLLSFWRNYQRAQFRVGEPIDLQKFVQEHPGDSDEVLARKVRGSLHHHLARETRAVFGPPRKAPQRVIEETLRDRVLRRSLEVLASQVTMQLTAARQIRELRRRLEARERRVSIVAPLYGRSDAAAVLLGGERTVLDVVPADGVILRLGDSVLGLGTVPPLDTVLGIVDELAAERPIWEALPLERPELAVEMP